MPIPRSFPPGAGRPFTLWQDPARWPVAPLKLPGASFSLWLDPAVWPPRTLRLPGRSFTLWLDPDRWPVSPLVLPGAGFTLWLNPETWPAPFLVPLPVPPLVSLPVTLPFPALPITMPQNKAFTLWTRPDQFTPILMRNGLTAAQLATATAATATLAAAPPHPLQPVPSTIGNTTAAVPVPFVHRLLPIAAGLAAVLGLNVLMNVSETKTAAMSTAEVAGMHQQIDLASKGLVEMKASNERAAVDFTEKAARLEAKSLVLKEENDRLVTKLTQALESIQKTEAKLAEKNALTASLSRDLDQAKLAAATGDTQAQRAVVAASEEASTVKRAAAAEVVQLRESLARTEAEKAAALREAATAAREKNALQQALDGLRKPAS